MGGQGTCGCPLTRHVFGARRRLRGGTRRTRRGGEIPTSATPGCRMGRDRPGSYGRRVQPAPPSSPSLPGVPPVPPGPPPAPPSTPRRRRWLRRALLGGGAVVVVVVLVVGAVVTWAYRGAKESNVGDLDFANELRIPPLAEPTIAADGTKEFDLRFTAGESDLVDAGPSETWGLNGTYLGPTRAGRGRRPGAHARHQRRRRAHHAALARHAPARRHGRRPAPAGRARRDVVARVDDRPARRVALVPPPPPRRRPPSTCTGARRACS